ncbi:MAG: PD-(D/E)XK nuclease family protein [Phycisphaeraceae bacterium]
MPVKLEFLGWSGPALPLAAMWLRDRYAKGRVCDLGKVIIVVPGARAGRRMLELLAESEGVLVPPTIITTGSLPERLYESPMRVAGELEVSLAWMHALRSAERAVLERIIPQPPEDGDLQGWLALARELTSLHDQLAGEAVTHEQVIEACEKNDSFNDAQRWQALGELHEGFTATLAARKMSDQNGARSEAIANEACRSEEDIILLATADLPQVTRRMLAQVADRVVALIHAPESERGAFDELGCLHPSAWRDRRIEVPDEIIHIVDRPRDQATQVLRLLEAVPIPAPAADEITLGVGDATMTSMLQRSLELAGLAAHAPVGRPLTQSRPALLLAALADLTARPRLDRFAAALRHPDLDAYLRRTLADAAADKAIIDWLSLLDEYIGEHLMGLTVGHWLGEERKAAQLKRVHEAVFDLLPGEPEVRRPLPVWMDAIASLLTRVYDAVGLDPHQPHDAVAARAIKTLGDALREQASLDEGDRLTPLVTFADAARFTLWRLADSETPVAAEPQGPAIELLGWLELQLDDAPHLIITGFNEHHIPQSADSDPYLPDHLKHELGLIDNTRRLARDAAAFTAILHSRPHLAIIAGRRGHDDEPLKPSRLLLTGDGSALADRVLRFYPKDPADDDSHATPPLLPVGKANRFALPRPQLPDQPLVKLRVTAFRDYLDCPYRFYLRHIRRLEAVDDHAVELDGLQFGNLAHRVLECFARGETRDSHDVEEIAAHLEDTLERTAAQTFGERPPAAVLIQIQQLRQRLIAFAQWQAEQVREGWRIVAKHTERSLVCPFDVDGLPLTLTGRVDRIDQRGDEYRILDYKTGDAGDDPESSHRTGPKDGKTWTNLQLPLYRLLAEPLGVRGKITLGYIRLSKKLKEIGLAAAEWNDAEVNEAIETGRHIIRQVRKGIFWPPREANAKRLDEFSAILMDEYLGRPQVIEELSRVWREGEVAP